MIFAYLYFFFSVNGVSKQLSKLNNGKAAGPDNLTSRILKEVHNEIAPILSDIYNSSLHEGKYQMTGGMPLLPQSTKRSQS